MRSGRRRCPGRRCLRRQAQAGKVEVASLVEEHVSRASARRVAVVPRDVGLLDERDVLVIEDAPSTTDLDDCNVVAVMRACAEVHDDGKEIVKAIWIFRVVRGVEESQREGEHDSVGQLDELCARVC